MSKNIKHIIIAVILIALGFWLHSVTHRAEPEAEQIKYVTNSDTSLVNAVKDLTEAVSSFEQSFSTKMDEQREINEQIFEHYYLSW